MEVDLTEFTAATNRAYSMGEVRRRDIAKVFRDANNPAIKTAKSLAEKSTFGSYSFKYPKRTHTAGNLKRGVRFRVSKRYKLVYYMVSSAWYSAIYSTGHHSFSGNKFMARAWHYQKNIVTSDIKDGLGKLTKRTWNG